MSKLPINSIRPLAFSQKKELNFWGLRKIFSGLEELKANSQNNYFATSTGNGVNTYIIDSGICAEHSQFLTYDGVPRTVQVIYDFTGGAGRDNYGHGTHVASLVAGSQFGVANRANVFCLKVTEKGMDFNEIELMKALDLTLRHHSVNSNGKTSVLLVSWWLERDAKIDAKILELTKAGILCVAAAGNTKKNAETISPAHLSEVLTVGALNEKNEVADFSGYGRSVDIYAPGTNIFGASNSSSSDIRELSGTSMAAAYVAGVAACHLERFPEATPAEVKKHIVGAALQNTIRGPVDGQNLVVFNPHQELTPHWVSENSLLGIFENASEVKIDLRCSLQAQQDITYKLIEGELPRGLEVSADGFLSGKIEILEKPENESLYFDLMIEATTANSKSSKLFYLVVPSKADAEVLNQNSKSVYLAKLSRCDCDRWNNCPDGLDGPPTDLHNCCFTQDSQILLHNGTKILLSDLSVGMNVMSREGRANSVVAINKVPLGGRALVSLNGKGGMFTEDHHFFSSTAEVSMKPAKESASTSRQIELLEQGGHLVGEDGRLVRIDSLTKIYPQEEQTLINVITDNDGTYFIEGLLTTSRFTIADNIFNKILKNGKTPQIRKLSLFKNT